ncbi:MAG: DUF5060 domain-containing protein [Acidobacteriaceae bacterium]
MSKSYDFVEITANIASPDAANPFEDATLTGSFEAMDGSGHWNVNGFCDSMDGSVFRIRFMPPRAGDYKYSVVYRQGKFQKSSTGDVSRSRRPSSRHPPGRSQVPLAFYLGRYRSAFFLQWNDCILDDGLEERSHD